MAELTVILKDSERTYRHKFLVYEPIVLSADTLEIRHYIEEAKKSFEGEPESITIKIHLEIQ